MRKQRWLGASAALVSLMLVLAACSTPGTSAGESAAESAGESVAPAGFKVCQITDTGGVDDKSFNQNAWEGVQRAESELGIEKALLESAAETDYVPNLKAFTDGSCDLVITVGYKLGPDTQAFAATNPDQLFAIVDFAYDPPPPNIYGLVFDTKSASMLQGYLAAGMTTTGKVGTFGGAQIPTVTDFMNGFAAGINYYNEQKGKSVELLGWDPATQEGLFTNDFDDLDKGRQSADGLMQEGADIILPVAGPVGEGAMAAIKDNGAGLDPAPMVIGVDVDQFISVPGYEDIMLSSVLKRMDNAVFAAIETAMGLDGANAWPETLYVGVLANEGVGMAEFHNFADAVPQELKDEIAALQAALTDGSVKADDFSGQPPASAAP